MSSKAKDGGGGKGGGGGDGGRDKKRKKKKGDKGDKCNKCKTLFPIMYKMKDLLSTLQPQCNQYRVELEAVKAENQKLRRRLGLPPASATALAPPAAAPAAPAASSSKRSTKTSSSAQAQTTTTKKLIPSSGGASLGNGGFGGRGVRGDGGGGRNDGRWAAGAPGTAAAAAATVTAAAAATPRKERSKGEKIRDWTAAVARNKRGRSHGCTGETAPYRGGAGGGRGNSGAGVGNAGSGGGSDSEEEWNGSAEEEPAQETGSVEVGRTERSSGGGGGGGGGCKKGKGKKKNKKKKEAALKPAGVFAAAEFSFLDDGKDNEEEEEEEEEEASDIDSDSDDDNGDSGQNRRRKPRKRSRTTSRSGTAASKGGRRGGANDGPVPRTSSMLARGFHAESDLHDDGWGDGEQAQEVEWYEDSPNEMEDLGWSQVWRRGDAVSAGGRVGGGGEGESNGDDGDGLNERLRAVAQKSLKIIDATSARGGGSGELVGPKGLSELLRLELTGVVAMDGVLVAVLRGRSLARDAGFLGRLVLRVVEGIDGAHVSPLTDPDVLTLVMEELEGLVELVVAPSALGVRDIGWGRETRLAVEFLTKTLLEGLEQARGTGDGGAEEDAPGGYSSMSFGNSKKKKKKMKANNSNRGEGDRDGPGDEGRSGWRAEAEAPVLWWWETDDSARVPWGVARLLGLLLRRLRKPEHTRSILHSILVRCVGSPARLLRFPLAFLEAFPGYFLPPHPPAPSAAAACFSSAHGSSGGAESGSGAVVVAGSEARDGEGDGGVLAPGLWSRAVRAVMFPPGGDGGGGGGGGGVGAAVVADRFKLVCLGEGVGSGVGGIGGIGGKGGSAGTAGEGEAPAKLAEKILQAIGALHQPQEGANYGDDRQGCCLCCGVGGDSGASGGDDALAMSSGLSVAGGGSEELLGELATSRCQGEMLAVEALRALRLLSVATEVGALSVGRRLEPVVRRAGVCQRAAALACHALAQCAGAGRSVGVGVAGGGGGGGVRPKARMMDMSVTKAARVLKGALESDPGKWEVGQIEEGFRLSHGAKAQAASALLALLEGRHGEVAAATERSIVEWTQKLEPKDRLSTPLPLLLSVTGLLSRPPAHVINLERRPYKWKVVSDFARREGVLLYRHVAVDSEGVDASSSGTGKGFISEKEVAMTWATELNTMHDKDCQKATTVDMHPSERACAASHLDLWKRHKLGKLAPFMPEVHADAVLILEDDAKLKPGFLECAKATMLQATAMDRDPMTKKVGLKKTWDILYLGHILPVPIINGISHSLKAKNGAEPNATEPPRDADSAEGPESTAPRPSAPTTPAPGTATASSAKALGLHVAPITFAWGLHAYLLTRDAAARLVDHLPVSAPADIFVGSFLAATDCSRPILAGRAVLPALATAPGGAAAAGAGGGTDVGDVVSIGTRRAGVAHGVWLGLSGRPAPVDGGGKGGT